jgi:hypothetical protein
VKVFHQGRVILVVVGRESDLAIRSWVGVNSEKASEARALAPR